MFCIASFCPAGWTRLRIRPVLTALALIAWVSGFGGIAAAQTPLTEVSPACPEVATPLQTEGPYYTPGSPERTSLREPGIPGESLVVTGYVFDSNCQPIPGAWLDFWQADGEGGYDNAGYKLRGHQFADASGLYRLETVMPGEYPGRAPHIHVKVGPPNGQVITTQLYFPTAAQGNERDFIFNDALLVELIAGLDASVAAFNFRLN